MSLVAQMVKNLPAMQETWVQSLGWEDPLQKGMATRSSIMAWRIPRGLKELDTTEQLSLLLKYFCMSHQFPLYYFTLVEFILNSIEVKFVSILKLLVFFIKVFLYFHCDIHFIFTFYFLFVINFHCCFLLILFLICFTEKVFLLLFLFPP